jgi:hypothetical protein
VKVLISAIAICILAAGAVQAGSKHGGKQSGPSTQGSKPGIGAGNGGN